jgi:PIN domain nuclease of toxin-antitoxin system
MGKRNSTTSMVDEHIVDTHPLIWYFEGSSRLGASARAVMQDPTSQLLLPAIALAEACWTIARGKTGIPSVAALLADVDADPRIRFVPLDRAVIDRSLTLTAIGEMHDRLIVATALLRADAGLSVAVLTRDSNIVASGLVSVVW